MNTSFSIRMATKEDAEQILKIYSPYVTDTAITFEDTVPSIKEFSQRIANTLKRYPYIVALVGGEIIGYAYASPFKQRAAYDWSVETTIYLSQHYRGKGFGKKVYVTLEDMLKRQNILNANACIAYTGVQDTHLDNTSADYHQQLGYTKVAHFTKCGYKFGKWYDMIWMEKMLSEHLAIPAAVIPAEKMQWTEAYFKALVEEEVPL